MSPVRKIPRDQLLNSAMETTLKFNSYLLNERRSRPKFFEINTQTIQVPLQTIPYIFQPNQTEYPVATVERQYTDNFTFV